MRTRPSRVLPLSQCELNAIVVERGSVAGLGQPLRGGGLAAPPALVVAVPPSHGRYEDAAARGIEDGAAVRIFNDRGSFSCAARVSDDARPGVLVAPMGWWNADYRKGRSGQATTSQALTTVGNAPTFNDNRVEVEPA